MAFKEYPVGYANEKIRIKDSWKVLDVGSGHNPHPRANVLLDKFEEDDTERSGDKIARPKGKKLVIGDAEDMPFKDKSFDYIIASHIAEHVNDPKKFCNELIRVGKAGYIETPGWVGDIVLNEPYHRWRIRKGGNKLIFKLVNKHYPLGFVGEIFYSFFYFNQERVGHKTIKSNNRYLRRLLTNVANFLGKIWTNDPLKDFTYTRFHWKNKFEVEVR